MRPTYCDFYSHLLLEEITENNALYHRSSITLTPGERVKIPITKEGTHWLANHKSEIALEMLRREDFPDKPSRFNCVYSTVVPRSRFIDKGFLYRVRPTGRTHIADSTYIDKIKERFDRSYYDRDPEADVERKKYYEEHPEELIDYLPHYASGYWGGATPDKNNLKDIEVLSDGAIVIEEVEESTKANPLHNNDDVIVTESGKLIASMDLYINSEDNKEPDMSPEQTKELIAYVRDHIFDNAAMAERRSNISFRGYLRKGAKFKIIGISSANRNGRTNSEDDDAPNGKYHTILLEFYIGDKLIHRKSEDNHISLGHRTSLWGWENTQASKKEKVYDFSKYLKKV